MTELINDRAERITSALESIARKDLPEHAEILGYAVGGAIGSGLWSQTARSKGRNGQSAGQSLHDIAENLASIAQTLKSIDRKLGAATKASGEKKILAA